MAVFALQGEQRIAVKAFVRRKDVSILLLTAFDKSLVLVWSHSLPIFRFSLFIPVSCKKGSLGTFCDIKDGLFSYLGRNSKCPTHLELLQLHLQSGDTVLCFHRSLLFHTNRDTEGLFEDGLFSFILLHMLFCVVPAVCVGVVVDVIPLCGKRTVIR